MYLERYRLLSSIPPATHEGFTTSVGFADGCGALEWLSARVDEDLDDSMMKVRQSRFYYYIDCRLEESRVSKVEIRGGGKRLRGWDAAGHNQQGSGPAQ